jgi:hypothetical protein
MLSPFDIAPPDLEPLNQALAKCGIGAEDIAYVADRLSRPPLSFGQTARADPRMFSERFPGGTVIYPDSTTGTWEAKPRKFDGDMAARMRRLKEGPPDKAATWKSLSRAERKAARRLWDWTGKAHGLSVTPQGRPPAIDPALVLYLIRVLCEASHQAEFRFSRTSKVPGEPKVPGGPMWRALIEALPLAQNFLAIRFGAPASGRISTKGVGETIAEIARVTRSKSFKNLSQTLGLGTTADDVAGSSAYARAVINNARSRKSRSRE